jgi:hypothetical protein
MYPSEDCPELVLFKLYDWFISDQHTVSLGDQMVADLILQTYIPLHMMLSNEHNSRYKIYTTYVPFYS